MKHLEIPVQLISTVIQQNLDDVQKMAFYAYINGLPWMATGGVKQSARGADSEAKDVRVEENLEAPAQREYSAPIKGGACKY